MANIYEFLSGYNALWSLIEEGEIDDAALIDAFDNMSADLSEKLENCCKYIKNQEATSAGLAEEIKRLQDRKRAVDNGIERMKNLMKIVMTAAGEKKIKCGTFTTSIQANPPKVVIDASVDDIPKKYLVPQVPAIDKKLILEFLKSGQQVEWAHIELSDSLRIR